MSDLVPASPFESIRHEDEQGEYWLARELMPVLEYSTWQRFTLAIERAMIDCKKSNRNVDGNFNIIVKNSNTAGRKANDYRLSRYACRLIVMTSETDGMIVSLARTYFSDRVDEAEALGNPDTAYLEWRKRAVASYMASGYTDEWANRRIDDIAARNALTVEWSIRGIKDKEYAILTDRLHMGSFGLTVAQHKELKQFEVTYKGKRIIYKGDLPPAMTATELALNALAATVTRELHVTNDSQGYTAIAKDVDTAGGIVGDTRRAIEAATNRPVVSSRNMIREPDGGIWATLPAPEDDDDTNE